MVNILIELVRPLFAHIPCKIKIVKITFFFERLKLKVTFLGKKNKAESFFNKVFN